MYIKLLIEALFVGVLLVIVGNFTMGRKVGLKNLFFTGILVHIIFEVLGLNKWYCVNGVACSSLKN